MSTTILSPHPVELPIASHPSTSSSSSSRTYPRRTSARRESDISPKPSANGSARSRSSRGKSNETILTRPTRDRETPKDADGDEDRQRKLTLTYRAGSKTSAPPEAGMSAANTRPKRSTRQEKSLRESSTSPFSTSTRRASRASASGSNLSVSPYPRGGTARKSSPKDTHGSDEPINGDVKANGNDTVSRTKNSIGWGESDSASGISEEDEPSLEIEKLEEEGEPELEDEAEMFDVQDEEVVEEEQLPPRLADDVVMEEERPVQVEVKVLGSTSVPTAEEREEVGLGVSSRVRKKRKWLKKGEVDPDDPIAVARQKERHAMIDEALANLERQLRMVQDETHPQLLRMWDTLRDRRNRHITKLEARFEFEVAELARVRDADQAQVREQWKFIRETKVDEIIVENRHKKSKAEAEKVSLKRNADNMPVLRDGRGGGGWPFYDGPLLSTGDQKVVPVHCGNVSRTRRKIELKITGADPEDIDDDLIRLGLRAPVVEAIKVSPSPSPPPPMVVPPPVRTVHAPPPVERYRVPPAPLPQAMPQHRPYNPYPEAWPPPRDRRNDGHPSSSKPDWTQPPPLSSSGSGSSSRRYEYDHRALAAKHAHDYYEQQRMLPPGPPPPVPSMNGRTRYSYWPTSTTTTTSSQGAKFSKGYLAPAPPPPPPPQSSAHDRQYRQPIYTHPPSRP